METPLFSLPQFNGPLDLLVHLVEKEEIDILEISLRALLTQFSGKSKEQIDLQTELLYLLASLMLLKSERLLPAEKKELKRELEDRMQLLETLIEYCRLKDAAAYLAERQESQSLLFPRKAAPPPPPSSSHLAPLSLSALLQPLKEIMAAAAREGRVIRDDEWQVSTKLLWLQELFAKRPLASFQEIFRPGSCRLEIIVTFLALLESIKMGKIHAFYEEGNLWLKSIS